MKISTLLRFLSCAFVATALSVNVFGQTELGRIKAARVQGEVKKLNASAESPLKDGDDVVQTDTIVTGKGASVVLVFANGSSVRLGSESRLSIDQFLMDPLDAPITNPGALKEEPSKSKTTLNLTYGEMVGDVKKLNSSSSYSIKTPVGAAGIRGTIYRIVYRPSSDGKAFFQIQTAEGLVVMEGVTNTDVPVAEGKEVIVEIDTEKPEEAKVQTKDISPADAAVITSASQELVQTLQNATIDPTPPTPPPAENKEETPPPPPPPPPVQDSPDLTPGSGKA
jgi:hypothetical protein